MTSSARRPAGGSRIEVENTGEPHLEDDAADVQQPPPDDEDQVQGEAVEGEVLEEFWDKGSVEDALMGMWNLQCLYYGLDYAADEGELEKAAEQLVPVFQQYVPPAMHGVIGSAAGGGLVATTVVRMYVQDKRARARRAPDGPLASLLGRRRPKPAGTPESAATAAAAAPTGPAPPGPDQGQQEQGQDERRQFTAEEVAAIRNHQGGPGDHALEAFGVGW